MRILDMLKDNYLTTTLTHEKHSFVIEKKSSIHPSLCVHLIFVYVPSCEVSHMFMKAKADFCCCFSDVCAYRY